MKNKIFIVGKQGVGKTQLADILSAAYGLPVTEGIQNMLSLPDEEGIYTSNVIDVVSAESAIPYGFTLIYLQ